MRLVDLGKRHARVCGEAFVLKGQTDKLQKKCESEQSKARLAANDLEAEKKKNLELLAKFSEAEKSVSSMKVEDSLQKELTTANEHCKKEFDRGMVEAVNSYALDVPVLKNKGFKHGWLKAFTLANAEAILPPAYEFEGIDPYTTDSEGEAPAPDNVAEVEADTEVASTENV